MANESGEFEGFLEDLRECYPTALTRRDFLLFVESTERELAELKSAARNLIAQKGSGVEPAYKRLMEVCK